MWKWWSNYCYSKRGTSIINPLDGSSYVLLPENATNEATTLVWNHADYDVQTEVNYDVEVALSGTNFATIIPAGSTNNRFVVWTVEALNGVALQAGLVPYTAGDLDIRIKSSLGSNEDMVAIQTLLNLLLHLLQQTYHNLQYQETTKDGAQEQHQELQLQDLDKLIMKVMFGLMVNSNLLHLTVQEFMTGVIQIGVIMEILQKY